MTVNPAAEIDRIFQGWGLEPDAELHQKSRMPSRMTQDNSLSADPIKQISKWKSAFTDTQIDAMLKVLKYFDITVYGEDAIPDIRRD